MTEGTLSRKLRAIACIIGCWLGLAAMVSAAEIQMQVQAAPGQPSALSPTGKLLTIEDAVRIGLENHPRIRSAYERVGSQQAVLGQQMSSYYPTISMSNSYRTAQASTSGGNDHAADAFASLTSFNFTLYNFGKREGNVQAARETLEATKQDYQTTNQDIILAIKQAYYVYLGAQALVNVRKDTVRSRELLVQQARGFYEVGTRARIDVARA
ncbi:MAG TPA: TolC family protein, partial [Candidatus Binatia bacterium]|nr:TolC family protein [Candidatus Binatia bacterium]